LVTLSTTSARPAIARPRVRPRIVFCDVDETLIACKSLVDFAMFRRRETVHTTPPRTLAALPREAANLRFYQSFAGESARLVAHQAAAWYTSRSQSPSFFVRATREELARHRAAGAWIVLVSGSMPALLRPIADAVGACRVLCSTPEVAGERFTGRLVGRPVIGEGKREAVRRCLAEFPGIRPQDCIGYGDHSSDAAMLEELGEAVIVGGDPELVRMLPDARVLARTLLNDDTAE
jgi:HAD superfamily hydrolase (TIGR01490 family)